MCSGPSLNRRHFLMVSAAALMTGCGAQQTGPAAIRWGKENCDYCGMIIDNPRFAGQLREKAGAKAWKFDDIGCAANYLARQPWSESPEVEFWVGDVDKGGWLEARKAWYQSGRKSPMSYDFGAVAETREGAVDYARFRALIAEKGAGTRCEPSQTGKS